MSALRASVLFCPQFWPESGGEGHTTAREELPEQPKAQGPSALSVLSSVCGCNSPQIHWLMGRSGRHPLASRPAEKGWAALCHQLRTALERLGRLEPQCPHLLGPPSRGLTPGLRGAPVRRGGSGHCDSPGGAARSSVAGRDRVKSVPGLPPCSLEMAPWFQNDSASPLNLYFTSEKLCIMQIVR